MKPRTKRRTIIVGVIAALLLVTGIFSAIAAWNAAGTGSAAATATALQPPTNFAASISGATATLSWAAPASGPAPSGYVLSGPTGDGAGSCAASMPASTTSCTVTGLTAGDSTWSLGAGLSSWRSATVTSNATRIALSPSTLPGATVGTAYSQTISATGGTSPYAYSLTGALPAGITFTAATGVLSGTPTQGGPFPITVTATDAAGKTGSQSYVLTVGTVAVTGPTVAVTYPANNAWYDDSYWTGGPAGCAAKSICGTVSGATGTVTSVKVQIQDLTAAGTNTCWNGARNADARFDQPCSSASFFAAGSNGSNYGSWTIATADAADLTDGHRYKVTVSAVDGAGTGTTSITFGFDKTNPTMGAGDVFVANSANGAVDAVKTGGGYAVYATVTDTGAGVGSVTADLTALGGGSAVALAPCSSSCSVRGHSYNYASAVQTVGAGVSAGAKKIDVSASDAATNANVTTIKNHAVQVDNTAPTASTVVTTNAGGVAGAGKPQANDTLAVTFSEAISVPSICSTWGDDDAMSGTIAGDVTVTIADNAASGGNDRLTLTSGTCTLHVGTFNLGNNGYVTGGDVTFTGSTLSWDGSRTLTLKLGTQGGAGSAQQVSGNATITYTPDAAITDQAGNAISGTRTSASARQF